MAYASTVPVTAVRPGARLFRGVFNIAAVCFAAALVTDVVYVENYQIMWADFSVWLITIGMVMAGIAVVLGLIEAAVEHQLGRWRAGWMGLAIIAAVLVVELFNAFVHSRDAYQSVYPSGVWLSAIAVALLLALPFVRVRGATERSAR